MRFDLIGLVRTGAVSDRVSTVRSSAKLFSELALVSPATVLHLNKSSSRRVMLFYF
jgi:hypothetical protein